MSVTGIAMYLGLAAFALGFLSVALSVHRIVRRLLAERAWVAAVNQHDTEHEQFVFDLVKEGRYLKRQSTLSHSLLGQHYLEQTVADLVRLLAAERTLPESAAREIEEALRQPSPEGRREYARKLVLEGLRGRVGVA
jgi:hypothetical protein